MKLIYFNHNKKPIFLSNLIIVVCIIFVGVISFGSRAVSVAYLKTDEAIYQGDPNKKQVSLMINVYWGTEYIEPILKTLKDNNVTATFFVGGSWVAQNNDVLALIDGTNCEIGNHGYYHKDHAKISKQQNQDEISRTHTLIKNLTKREMTLFAPPSGAYNKTTLDVAKSLGYKTIMWSKDTIDWRDQNEDLIFNRATQKLCNGDLILLHPTEKTMTILDKIIKSIKEQGFELVTVSKNIS